MVLLVRDALGNYDVWIDNRPVATLSGSRRRVSISLTAGGETNTLVEVRSRTAKADAKRLARELFSRYPLDALVNAAKGGPSDVDELRRRLQEA